MAVSVWSEAIPSGTSLVGTFPTYGRTTFAGIGASMGIEHFWPGSGGGSDASAGDLRPGGSRCFFDVRSQSSVPSQGTARLFFGNDIPRLYAYESAGTYLVGTAGADEHASNAGSLYWAKQTGSFVTSVATGTLAISFAVPYAGASLNSIAVFGTSSSSVVLLQVNAQNQGALGSTWSSLVASPSTFTVFWEALGLISSASF